MSSTLLSLWSHATNCLALLDSALQSPNVDMIEADVTMGTLIGQEANQVLLPIMAHPPNETSDLSLSKFMSKIANFEGDTKSIKVVKLDFKTISAVDESLKIAKSALLNAKNACSFELWLNADILKGPLEREEMAASPVDPRAFLELVKTHLPDTTLSPGFTTNYHQDNSLKYSQEQISEMLALLQQFPFSKVTFPVRAVFACNSQEELASLLEQTGPGSTLTIWGQDKLTSDQVKSLSQLISQIGENRIYLDVYEDLINQLLAQLHHHK